AEILRRYHVPSEAAHAALDAHWQEQLAASPAERAGFERAFGEDTAWLRGARREVTWSSSPSRCSRKKARRVTSSCAPDARWPWAATVDVDGRPYTTYGVDPLDAIESAGAMATAAPGSRPASPRAPGPGVRVRLPGLRARLDEGEAQGVLH